MFTLPDKLGARREPSRKDPDAGRLPNGATLGRYVVTGVVGVGGMGVVYSARDPDLDRNVALKVLRPELSVEARSRARLLGEARAMAQLSHPNVVPVYDVGVLDDHVFIAMELVEGQTLRRKLDRSTPWRSVVEIYLQAARGLAAAHAAGLVHRDFKPDNVLYGSDGRIRVVDFGLVAADPLDPVPPGSPARINLGADIETTAGVVLGTPAFMAPEAMRGEVTDPRADQFSFCVAVFHGLYGEYPHTGGTLPERAEQIARGAIKKPVGTQVPERIYRLLVRGLQAKPEDRYPSMEALVDAFEHALRRRRRRGAVLVTGAAAFVAGVSLAAWAVMHERGARPPPERFGAPETIAHSEDKQLEIGMLRDGRYVRVERGTVTVVTADGTSSRELPPPAGVVPSHVRTSVDGWAEIRTTAPGKPCTWWLVPVDGGKWNPLIDDPTCTSEVDLSPDASQLAVATSTALAVRNLATGTQRTVAAIAGGDDARRPSWSPDGKRLAIGGAVAISVIDVATGTTVFRGHPGVAVSWLDPSHLIYVAPNWLRCDLQIIDLATGAETTATTVEGNVGAIGVKPGAILVQRDEFHSRIHLASTAATTAARLDDLPQLDTGSAIDFWPAVWADSGALITLAMVAGQRGLVGTMPGQRGAPLITDKARNIAAISATARQVIYMTNDGSPDCDARIYDIASHKVQSWHLDCQQRYAVSCARSLPRCLVVDKSGTRWFNPELAAFDGAAPRTLSDEDKLSPDARQTARVHGSTIVLRDVATEDESRIEVPVTGNLEVAWGADASTLIVVSTEGNRRRMLVWNQGQWRTIIDEPHRQINGYVVSPDGSQVATVAVFTTSTWSLLPIEPARP